MDIGIEFRLNWFDNDGLNLTVFAWNGFFGGAAEIFEAVGDLRAAADQLRGFPTNPSDERLLVFGNFGRRCAAGGIRMRFHCVDRAGHAYVEATIDSNYSQGGTIQTAVLAMPVEATAVDIFVEELRRVEVQRGGGAHLRAKPLGC